eukprot:scaffold51304_cov59-Attheya_sp.AAC.3
MSCIRTKPTSIGTKLKFGEEMEANRTKTFMHKFYPVMPRTLVIKAIIWILHLESAPSALSALLSALHGVL